MIISVNRDIVFDVNENKYGIVLLAVEVKCKKLKKKTEKKNLFSLKISSFASTYKLVYGD